MVIKKLDKDTINLISAGEVIDGPADILKELLENSIDAGATEININVLNSGIDLLEIKDNGQGISKEDLKICTERHTTSKLTKIDDLYSISTFGFRGEALASINAVSKLKIISSINESGKGYCLENEKITEINSKKGTTIIVKDLFYNLQVRKKFLKSKSSEFALLYEVFLANALLYPEIRFSFNSEKKKIIFSSSTEINRFNQIFGQEIIQKTKQINISTDLLKVSGRISTPTNPFYFSTNFLFINKRHVLSSQIQKLITSCYKDYLMVQQKPFFILFIELDPKTVDVNVHPKKKIVKLQNEMLFLSILKDAIEKELFPKENTPIYSNITSVNFEPLSERKLFDSKTKPTYNADFDYLNSKQLSDFVDVSYPKYTSANTHNTTTENASLNFNNHHITKILGQIHNTYIVCETTDGLLLFDQHAAAERINLEKNRQKFMHNFNKQKLINKKELTNLSVAHKECILKNKSKLSALGFELDISHNKYYLVTIPQFLDNYLTDTYFINLLDDILSNEEEITKLKDNLIKLFTCKNSIKANFPLSIYDQINLIKELDACVDKTICAHGRPTTTFFSTKELEKLFKRIV